MMDLRDEDFDRTEYEDHARYWVWFDEGDEPFYVVPHRAGMILRDGQWEVVGHTPLNESKRERFSVWKKLVAERGSTIPDEALNLPGPGHR